MKPRCAACPSSISGDRFPANGATLTEAAQAAGIQRNTIANWRAFDIGSRNALNDALYDKSALFREQVQKLIDDA